jgi:hypothetical protein
MPIPFWHVVTLHVARRTFPVAWFPILHVVCCMSDAAPSHAQRIAAAHRN